MAANSPSSPRQKMINLMYLVFIAMLALNIPAEVLDGLELVEDGLEQTIISTQSQNSLLMAKLTDNYNQNPEKAGEWYGSASKFTQQSDSLYNYIQSLKIAIVRNADGEKANVKDIKSKDGIDPSFNVMFGKQNEAIKLKDKIIAYRQNAGNLVSDSKLKKAIADRMTTEPTQKAKKEGKTWEESMFAQMPTSAAVTLLTKIQSDLRSVQSEVLSDLLSRIGGDDYRVNSLYADVVPKSMIVMQGASYEGQIILSAVDTTKRPRIFIGNTMLDASKNGFFQVGAGSAGSNKIFQGHIEIDRINKDPLKIPFKSTYSVIEPMATVASVRMNVLYAGINNELSISVPGITNDNISASVTNGNGTVSGSGKSWNARPSKVGQDMVVSVTAEINGRRMEVAKQIFKVRALPDPTPYIEYKDADGNPKMFKGGRITKAAIVTAPGIRAAVDDGLINIPFSVLSFTMVSVDAMGDGSREVSDGANFSERQKEKITRMQRGKSFFITDVKAKGPDGIVRDITAIEVRVN